MRRIYGDRRRNVGVWAYEEDPKWIRLWFHGERESYTYTGRKVGSAHVDEMKRLAHAGKGLTTYINQHRMVRDGYTRR